MELPTGRKKLQGIVLAKGNPAARLEELANSGFTGYVPLTILGNSGIEEGSIIFKSGKIRGANFLYPAFGKEFYGTEALKQCFNALAAKKGIFEAIELSEQQVELTLALKEELSVEGVKASDFKKIIPAGYSKEFSEKVSKEFAGKESKAELFKKLGFAGLE